MIWKKEKEPYRAELFHDAELEFDGEIIASANKENTIAGTVTHYAYRKIGNKNVQFCLFHPDIKPESCWAFSRKWIRALKRKEDTHAN